MNWRYNTLLRLALPLVFGYFYWRGRKAPAYRQRWAERLALQQVPLAARDGLLIHCVSVGETVAARLLIEQLLARYPQLPVTLTSMTPTAATLAQQWFGDRVHHAYLPIDTPAAVRRFLRAYQPRAMILLETEVWPNLLTQLHQQQRPVALVNARMSEPSCQQYQRHQWLLDGLWQQLDLVLCQTHDSARRFRQLGVPAERLEVRGNLKFDLRVNPQLLQQGRDWRAQLQRPVVVAASTHQGEDELVLQAFAQLLTQLPDALLILVPRHPERFAAVTALASSQFQVVTRASGVPIVPQHQVLIGDTMGELLLWYAMAEVAFVGGSLIARGGHNPLEPVATQTAVVSGPAVFNFAEIYQRLQAVKAVVMVDDAAQLAQQWQALLQQPAQRQQMTQAASAEFASDQGATERYLHDLHVWLTAPTASPRPALPMHLPTSRMLSMMQQAVSPQGSTIWYDDDCLSSCPDDYFEPHYWQQQQRVLGSATGRATAWFVQAEQQALLLRHYYRGGLVGKFNRDRFAREPLETSRAMAEFSLLLKLRELGLPVPRPVAARYRPAPGWGYRADILVAVIGQAQDVFKRLQQHALSAETWQQIGATIARFHRLGVYHSDLNCHNIMLDAEQHVWLVDFDKCDLRAAGDWQQANVARLLRSLHKELAKAQAQQQAFHWQQQRDWPPLLQGYQQGMAG